MGDLRRARVEDAAALTRLRGLMLAAMGSDVADPHWAQACEAAFVRRLGETDRFAAWLVDVDGVPVASGVGWLEEHLPSPAAPDGRRGHIASMSTDPAHRRAGHARQVFGALMGWFGALGVPRVDLRATGDGQPLYESFGFRVLGGASMSWTAPGAGPPGMGFATRR